MGAKDYDFSGYATKVGLKCSDGRTILKDAFKEQDGQTVPLVWQHLHNEPENVIGKAVLENREDGVYCYGTFNDTYNGQNAKELVRHGDVNALSIYANQLQERSKKVIHGSIKEVSLVLAGANPGALIDNLNFAHGDGEYTVDDTEAIIYTGLTLSHSDSDKEDDDTNQDDKSKKENDKTVAEIFDTLTDEQKTVVYALIAQAIGESAEKEMSHSFDSVEDFQTMFNSLTDEQKDVVYSALSGDSESNIIKHDGGSSFMKRNVFEAAENNKNVLSHDQLKEILSDGKRYGSLKESFLAHAEEYGFNPVDVLFPDAVATNENGPEVWKREDTWVSEFLNSATHTPFSRIKTVVANMTVDEARARGYVTGNIKKDQVVSLLKRVTTPTTIYKKQKLDRDDLEDITDFNVVMWLKKEMRAMLNEELARACLIGDGRNVSDEDKINEQNIRPIALDDDNVYVVRSIVEPDTKVDEIIDEFIRARKDYKGSGSPVLYTSTDLLTEMLLVKDSMGRRMYSNVQELASVLRVSKIIEVELMNNAKRKVSDTEYHDILGVVVNMKDYTIGATKGGEVSMFDDFDIDYNQHKYLIETRVSGALTRPKSAIVIERKQAEPSGV